MKKDISEFIETEYSVQKSSIGFISSAQLPNIIQQFNQETNSTRQRPSILKNINFFGISLFKYRILASDELRLVQRNGIPELAMYSGKYQRRKKVWSLWKPWTWFRIFRDDSSTIGIYKISDINTQGYIGHVDRHLVSVNQGEYAKVIINGEPIFLDEGAHIIKTNNFSYAGKVKKSVSFTEHENLYRLQVPSAKIAAVSIDNEPYLLAAGTYFIRSNNFKLVRPNTNPHQLFYHSADPVIQCGSLLRLMPTANTVAIYYQNGKQKIFPQENEKIDTREKLIDDANVEFSTFLPTNLINRHYPSKSTSAQFEYYTKDSVKVGVRLFVAYRITNPTLALEKLDPIEIDKHIEYVTHVDMAVAGQKTSLQGIQSSDDLRANASTSRINDGTTSPPTYNQVFISVWQDLVKNELSKHLNEYGIELVRLNIEEIAILNKEVEKKIAEQAYRVAKASADLAALDMETHVLEQNALTASRIEQIKAKQAAQTQLIAAKNKTEVAEIEAKTRITKAEAEAKSLTLEGEALTNNPELLRLKLVTIQASALKSSDKVIVSDNPNNLALGLLNAGLYTLPPPTTYQIPSQANSLASAPIR